DAPVLSGSNDFTGISEDDTANSGNLVSDLLAGKVTDVDSAAAGGIAVTGLLSGSGTWQWSSNGSSWSDVGTVSDAQALLLPPGYRLRLVPDGRNGTFGALVFRAWDQSGASSGLQGTRFNVTAAGTGGVTPFS